MLDFQNLFLHRRLNLLFTTLAQVSLEFWAVSLNFLRETAYPIGCGIFMVIMDHQAMGFPIVFLFLMSTSMG